MTEPDNFKVMKNEESGAEVYQCNICSSKYGTKKAIRTHMTTKHKPKKKNDGKSDDKVDEKSDEKNENDKEDTELELDEDVVIEEFENLDDFNPSTQNDKTVAIEDIFKFYESNDEFLKDNEKDGAKSSHATMIPDDTMDKIIEEETDEPATNTIAKEDLFAENMILKSKLKSAEDLVKEREQKAIEDETSLIDANTELEKVRDEIKLKNEENEVLIGEKNKLEENVVKCNGMIQKMFKERANMKNMIEKQKTTIELTKQRAGIEALDNTDEELKVKILQKTKELDEANKDKRRLAKDLAEAQNKDKDNDTGSGDADKCSKLTNLLKNQKADTKKANDDLKRLTTANKELQERLNKANNSNTAFVTKTTRLEKQVEDLIETCGENARKDTKKVSFEEPKSNDKFQSKCIHNDRGRCRNQSCNFVHSNVVCMPYSKIGFCETQEQCPKRHPVGICLHWKRGYCDKEEATCFYRHPEEEFGVMKGDGSRTPDMKRKRTFSNPNIASSPDRSDSHFLYQKVIELTRKLDAKNETNQARPESVPRASHPDRPEQYPRQNQSNQFQRTSSADQFTRQTVPSYYAAPVADYAPVRPVQPVAGWNMSNVMPQWGGQGGYPGNPTM